MTSRGHELMLLEGERVPGYSAWRVFLYDDETRVADEIGFKTHAGSQAFSNPSISEVRIDGHDAILVTLYLFTEGSRGGEDGAHLLPDAARAVAGMGAIDFRTFNSTIPEA